MPASRCWFWGSVFVGGSSEVVPNLTRISTEGETRSRSDSLVLEGKISGSRSALRNPSRAEIEVFCRGHVTVRWVEPTGNTSRVMVHILCADKIKAKGKTQVKMDVWSTYPSDSQFARCGVVWSTYSSDSQFSRRGVTDEVSCLRPHPPRLLCSP